MNRAVTWKYGKEWTMGTEGDPTIQELKMDNTALSIPYSLNASIETYLRTIFRLAAITK